MSCNNSCDPCASGTVQQEGVLSQLENLVSALFGGLTKTYDANGRATWSAPCSTETAGLTCYPRLEDEGFVCYFLRLMSQIGVFNPTVWDVSTAYCKNTLVSGGSALYVAKQDVPAGTPITDPAYYLLVLASAVGPQGPQGPAGTGSAVNYNIRSTGVGTALTNTDAVLFCNGTFSVTIPAIGTLDAGKWFVVNNVGSGTITVTGVETINGAASVTLVPDESLYIVSNGTNWRIV